MKENGISTIPPPSNKLVELVLNGHGLVLNLKDMTGIQGIIQSLKLVLKLVPRLVQRLVLKTRPKNSS